MLYVPNPTSLCLMEVITLVIAYCLPCSNVSLYKWSLHFTQRLHSIIVRKTSKIPQSYLLFQLPFHPLFSINPFSHSELLEHTQPRPLNSTPFLLYGSSEITCWLNFSVTVIKYCDKSNSRDKQVLLVHTCRSQSIMSDKSEQSRALRHLVTLLHPPSRSPTP